MSPGLVAPRTRQSSSHPHLCSGQTSSPSPTLQKIFSNRLNAWPSSSSLSPSIKTVSSAGNTSKASIGSHINYFIQSRSVSPRGSSLSFSVENASPYTNRTPSRPMHLSPSPRGPTANKGFSTCSPMKEETTDVSNRASYTCSAFRSIIHDNYQILLRRYSWLSSIL